ncbi:MAG TPA: extracellular solute-binding protein [Acetobacteraceae bacterium]|nr:extracellular solute-binding protein [Acetobacteraceae bacterium]
MPSSVSRRRVLAATALLSAPAILSRRASAAERCVVGTWGGDYARLLRENIDDPILKPEGVDVVQDIGDVNPRIAKVYAQRALPHGTDDIACVDAMNGYRLNAAGLVVDLTETEVPNLKNVRPELRLAGFVPHIFSAQVLLYNPSTVKNPPHSLADFLDPQWRGKVGMLATGGPFILQAASLLETGTTTDFDKAKAFMLKLQANGLRLYPETDNLAPAFKSGEIDVGMIWLARNVMWQNAGFPVQANFPKEGSVLYVSGMVMPKNAPDKEAAHKYMNALLEPSAQQGFAAHMGYLPTVTDAPLTGKIAEQLALPQPAPKLVPPDYEVLAKAMPDINDWWLKNMQHG